MAFQHAFTNMLVEKFISDHDMLQIMGEPPMATVPFKQDVVAILKDLVSVAEVLSTPVVMTNSHHRIDRDVFHPDQRVTYTCRVRDMDRFNRQLERARAMLRTFEGLEAQVLRHAAEEPPRSPPSTPPNTRHPQPLAVGTSPRPSPPAKIDA